MIYLYSATPGTGKTCWVVKQLIDHWLDDPENANRKIYHNINGLKVEGLYPAPDDFRQCEDGSIIIYDEAQDIKHYSSDSRADNPIAKELSKHRHRGFDIHFITQDPSLLHKYVLKNTYLHYYLWRPAQRKKIEIYTFARAIVSPTKTDFKNAYDRRIWRFEERYLKYYKSTVVNTSKKVASQKMIGVIITGIIFALMIGAVIYPAVKSALFSKKDDEPSKQAVVNERQYRNASKPPEPPQDPQNPNTEANQRMIIDEQRKALYQTMLPTDYELIKQDPNLQVRGVIKMGNRCRAYNTHGDLMTLDLSDCQYYIKQSGRVHKPSNVQAVSQWIVPTDDVQAVSDVGKINPISGEDPPKN